MAPKEIDFGYRSVEQYWIEAVLPSFEEFKLAPDRASAIKASIRAWHILEWLWHERQPSQPLDDFRANILKACPELAWLRDVVEGGKHRVLKRSDVTVKGVLPPWVKVLGAFNTFAFNTMTYGGRVVTGPLSIELDAGTTQSFSDVLSRVIDYWRDNYFPPKLVGRISKA
jgi:hypothetical protein